MTLFLWNLLLAIAWAFAVSDFSLAQLLVGYAIGYVILYFSRRLFDSPSYFRRMPAAVRFIGFIFWELLVANVRVARDVVTPVHRMRPGVIAIPLDAKSNVEVTMLANLISLTPGSLALFLSPDRTALYIHIMYLAEDADATREKLKQTFERRVLELLR